MGSQHSLRLRQSVLESKCSGQAANGMERRGLRRCGHMGPQISGKQKVTPWGMTLDMEGQPFLLQFSVWACVFVFLASFVTALYANMLVINRTEVLLNRAEDRALSCGERANRKTSRFNRFLVADEFRSLRRLCLGAWTGATVAGSIRF